MLNEWLESIYEAERPPYDVPDCDGVLQDIGLFGLHSQVYHLLQSFGWLERFPDAFRNELKEKYNRGYIQNLFIKRKEEEALRLLDDSGIPAIPLKGVRFAESYYGHFAARATSDIDLLVRRNRLPHAIEALVSEGYRHEITKDHHARLHRGGLMIELHWTLDIPEWSRLDPERFWNNAAVLPTYRHARELSASDTLYFACLHGARHQMSSLRYLLDIVQILEHCADFIELDALLEQAEADRTSRRIQAVLSIVYDQFPHLHAVKPLPFPILKTPWTYDIVRSARQGKKSLDYYAYKLFFRHQIFDTWTHRLLSLRKAY